MEQLVDLPCKLLNQFRYSFSHYSMPTVIINCDRVMVVVVELKISHSLNRLETRDWENWLVFNWYHYSERAIGNFMPLRKS